MKRIQRHYLSVALLTVLPLAWLLSISCETFAYYQSYLACGIGIGVSGILFLVINNLVAARIAAEQASNLKSQFLAKISHEIRTPMNGLLGMTALLEQTELNEEQLEYVQTIQVSAENLLHILNELLDFSKLEAGEMQVETVDFDLRDCVQQAVNLLTQQTQKKGLQMKVEIDPEVPRQLQGSPCRLRQILLNLISNSIKFTESGEVVVNVSVSGEPKVAQSGYLLVPIYFSVRDTGIGIASQDQDKLFQVFSQVDASIPSRYGGTGLGLVICQQLVELMGGQIGLESEVGVGSTFWFTIPFLTPASRFAIEQVSEPSPMLTS
ncbi:MAG: ATP-binding protein [Prochloraceae cyanobacterium]